MKRDKLPEYLPELRARLKTVQELLNDPHPGLEAWCSALILAMDALTQWWQE